MLATLLQKLDELGAGRQRCGRNGDRPVAVTVPQTDLDPEAFLLKNRWNPGDDAPSIPPDLPEVDLRDEDQAVAPDR